ncbi:AAA family ATPase [Tritonibacter scottomollicae]
MSQLDLSKSARPEARKNAPCILFIDEIDAIGSVRRAFRRH